MEKEYRVAETGEKPYIMTSESIKLKGHLMIGFETIPYEADEIPIYSTNLENIHILIGEQKCILKGIRTVINYEDEYFDYIETGIPKNKISGIGMFLTVIGYIE